jgi:type II secretion system protein G
MLARIRKSMEEKDEGFTLIELLVVIIIIGILAAIAIPVFLNQRKKGWDSQAKSDVRNVQTEVETYFVDGQAYPVAVAVGPAPTPAVATTVYYKKSPNTAGVVYKTTGTGSTAAYCISSKSDSGSYFSVTNGTSGVQGPATADPC